MANEFDDLDNSSDDFSDPAPEAVAPLISQNTGMQAYDYNAAPDYVKAPPRVPMNGKTVIINKAEILLPAKEEPWGKTRDKKIDVKSCEFRLYYDFQGQQETVSGIRVFKKEGGLYSHPSMTADRNNQASVLRGIYADYKKKDINEVSLKELMMFLNSKPKCIIKEVSATNPKTNKPVIKNLPGEFVN